MTIADRIRAERKRLGYSQTTLAIAAGLSERTIQNAEAGKSITGESLRAIRAVLNISEQDGHTTIPVVEREGEPGKPKGKFDILGTGIALVVLGVVCFGSYTLFKSAEAHRDEVVGRVADHVVDTILKDVEAVSASRPPLAATVIDKTPDGLTRLTFEGLTKDQCRKLIASVQGQDIHSLSVRRRAVDMSSPDPNLCYPDATSGMSIPLLPPRIPTVTYRGINDIVVVVEPASAKP